VDDEEAIRLDLSYALGDAGHHVTAAADGAEAGDLLSRRVFDVALIDVRLPKIDGLSLFRKARAHSPDMAVILLTAHASVPDAVSALKDGAFDYVAKPFDSEELTLRVIGRVAERCALRRALRRAQPRPERELIGQTPALLRLLDQLDVVAGNDAPVLITGESGTGKEVIARMLHDRSPRSSGPFVAVSCAALPEALLEAELFGHERGAYTGADRRRDGRFQAAEGGTLLLDEVSEIPLAAQTKLLRVLQEGTVEPLGSSSPVPVNVRVISATNRSLRDLVAAHAFREDLYYRLNVLDLNVPPLRERRNDLPLLVDHFLRRFAPPGAPLPALSARARDCLLSYAYPGNVRELEHAIERAVVLSHGGEIQLEHLPIDMVGGPTLQAPAPEAALPSLRQAVRVFERDYLARALTLSGGRRAEAAQRLGISRKTLWQKLRRHGLGDAGDDES